MMDVSRFGMEYNPFLKNSKEVLVETAQYREALFRLSYLEKTKGFGLLTGGPGRGKTTALMLDGILNGVATAQSPQIKISL